MKTEDVNLSAKDVECPSGFKIIGKKVYMIWGEGPKTGLNMVLALEQTLLTDEEVINLGLAPRYQKEGDGNYAMIYAVAKSSEDYMSEILAINPSDRREIRMGVPYYRTWGTRIESMMMDDAFWKTPHEVEIQRQKEKNYDDSDND